MQQTIQESTELHRLTDRAVNDWLEELKVLPPTLRMTKLRYAVQSAVESAYQAGCVDTLIAMQEKQARK